MQPGLERSQQTSLQSLPTSPFASRSSPSPVLAHFVRSHLSFSNGLVIGSVWRKLDQIPAPFRFLPSSNKDKSPRRANILVPSRLRAQRRYAVRRRHTRICTHAAARNGALFAFVKSSP